MRDNRKLFKEREREREEEEEEEEELEITWETIKKLFLKKIPSYLL